jgi:hypothetical protein
MMKILSVLSIVLALIFNSCSGSDSETKLSLKTGKYNYKLTDSSGTSLVEGIMQLDTFTVQKVGSSTRDYVISGNYTVTKMTDDTSYIAFSSLNPGELKGYYNDSTKFININTNPRIADANVFLNAIVLKGDMKGGWHYSTFRGTRQEAGLFTATRIK